MPTASVALPRSAATSPASSRSRRDGRRREALDGRLRQARIDRAKYLRKGLPERDIDVGHGHGEAEVDQGGDAVTGIDDAAGHDRREMRKIRLDVDRDAVERDPAPQADADRGDLVLKAFALVGALDPDPDAVLAALAADVEGGQRPDDPFFQPGVVGAYVRPALLQVEHDIGDPLAGPVIGDLAAAAGL